MRVTYTGPAAEVHVADSGQTCARGESIEVDAALGARLVEQSVWSEVKPPKADRAKADKQEREQ
jgi:hypothetical protein